jgi:polyhydroxyalkanoate synthase
MLVFSLLLSCALTAQAPLPNRCPGTESVGLQTGDGARVQLHHHPGAGPPVVVIHGISSNHRCWDLTPERSLAVSLTEAGYDAWLLDLRGHGDAIVPQGSKHGWTLDEYGGRDLARAISHVQLTTGHTEVAIVGHSMGGLVAAAYHGLHGDSAIGALVVVGSPLDFSEPGAMLRLAQVSFGLGAVLQRFRSEVPARLIAKVPGPVPLHGEGILFNGHNLAPAVRKQMLKEIVSPVSREELKHFSTMMRTGRFTSADGEVDYIERLSTLESPLLVISGAVDRIAPPERVQPWIAASGSPNETYIEAGKQAGMQEDYGHLDLAFGDRARDEIHSLITRWLDHHYRRPTPAQAVP